MYDVRSSICLLTLLLTLPAMISHQLTADGLDNRKEDIEETRNVIVLAGGEVVSSTLINGVHAPRITVQSIFKGTSYVIDLTLNTHLVPSTYVEKIVTENGTIYRHFDRNMEMCYYGGEVRDHPNSKAAFSTCEGLKGFFVLDNITFHVNPRQLGSSLFQLYEIKKVADDNLSEWICGVKDFKEIFKRSADSRAKRQIISESLDGQNVVELYVANDIRRLNYFNNDMNRLSASTKEIVNTANLLYQAVGFFIVLVGTEHWTSDQIDVNVDSSLTLKNWHEYRSSKIVGQHYNDVGFLISRQNFDASVLGLANIATMCSSSNSGGIMTAILDISAVSGAILAHEIGHVFGLSHDSSNCACESTDVSCIMSPRASTSKPALYFSTCSKSQLKTSVERGFDICLKDLPLDQSSHYQICGNGILEQGEECDCGRRLSQECNAGCCDKNTCKLIGQAKCASGKCCDVSSCQLKQVGFRCRSAIGPCDITEVCDGNSALCPKNVYKHDGIACSVNGVDAYCWGGMCRSQRSQCNELFGPSVPEGNPLCYQTYNIIGTPTSGYCSYQNNKYSGCQPEDVMCGALQCDIKDGNLIRYTNFIQQITKPLGPYRCRNILFDYGTRVENPGMVPNGAACGVGKMCVSQKCISAESKLKENPCPNCNDRVCTNEGKCICDPDTTCVGSETTTPLKTVITGAATTTTTTTPRTTTTSTITDTPRVIPNIITATTTSIPRTTTTSISHTTKTTTTTTTRTPSIIIITTPAMIPSTTTNTSTTTIMPESSTRVHFISTPETTTSIPEYPGSDYGLSFSSKLAIGLIVPFILLFLLLLVVCLCRKDLWQKFKEIIRNCSASLSARKMSLMPVKAASEFNQRTYSNRSPGQNNKAYESDSGRVAVISRQALVVPNTRVNSWYPQSTDDQESYDAYEELNVGQLRFNPAPNNHKTPFIISLESPTTPPARPPLPPQHLKPKSTGPVPAPPPQSLKPNAVLKTVSKPSDLVSRPPVPPASAKPKPASKASHQPARPLLPPQVSPPIPPPAFPSKPKPSRTAPPAPSHSTRSRSPDGEDTNAVDVRGLKAMFEISMV